MGSWSAREWGAACLVGVAALAAAIGWLDWSPLWLVPVCGLGAGIFYTAAKPVPAAVSATPAVDPTASPAPEPDAETEPRRRPEPLSLAVEDKLRAIVDYAPVAMWMSTPTFSRVLFVNEAYATIWDCAKDDLYHNPEHWLLRVHPDDVRRVQYSLSTRASRTGYDINYRILRGEGEVRYIREIGRCVGDGPLCWVVSAMDITSEMYVRDELHELNNRLREANLQLQENARLDNLTRCLNRSAFFEEAEKALQLEQRYGRSSSLVFFDLNNFKEVNDNFGHHVGDQVLIAFSEQIKARLRTTDELGRYGGDEFVGLLRETDAEQARALLATLTPVVVDADNGNSLILRFSAGVACSSDPGINTVDDWMRIADTHMYQHKTRRNA